MNLTSEDYGERPPAACQHPRARTISRPAKRLGNEQKKARWFHYVSAQSRRLDPEEARGSGRSLDCFRPAGIVVSKFCGEFLDPYPIPCSAIAQRNRASTKVVFGYRSAAEGVWPTITL
jgi:hypothetical protein